MTISIEINGQTETVDINNPIDISIPLQFNGSQPNAYGVEKAAAKACVAGEIVGDTRRGGNCNFEQYTLIPHCNGTHTECVGHITCDRIHIIECLKDTFIPAVLVSVEPENATDTDETYAVNRQTLRRGQTIKSPNVLGNRTRQFCDKFGNANKQDGHRVGLCSERDR